MTEPKKKSGPWFIIIIVLLFVALAVEAVILFAPQFSRRPAAAWGSIKNDPITYFGTKTAPVQIEFYAPLTLEWHKKTIGLLKEYDKQHPGRIYVTLMPIGNPEADQKMNARGFECAVIMINGKYEFTLPGGKQVDLEKRPNNGEGSSYNSEDVITVLENLKLPQT